MASAAAPPPIQGIPIDPPPAEVPAYAEKLDRTTLGGIAFRVYRRWSYGNVGLLANGTAYYMLLSLFSLVAFAYGVTAAVGADWLATTLTEALNEALPGLVGTNGIDTESLRASGQAAGLIGALLLLYGSLGAVNAAGTALHLIFGAPPDPRAFPKAKARDALVIVTVAPLLVLTFAASSVTASWLDPIMQRIGLDSAVARTSVSVVALIVGFGLDTLITWLLIGHLGGIRPLPRPRLIGALLGAVMVTLIKALLGVLIGWVLDKPQYGAFAAPLAVLFVFSLLAQALYIAAAVAAGISDEDRPLADLQPTEEDAVPAATGPIEPDASRELDDPGRV